MSEVITKLVVDLSRDANDPLRVQSIPLTAEELAEREAMQIQAEAERLQREALEAQKVADKQSAIEKLAALGLSDTEIAALLG